MGGCRTRWCASSERHAVRGWRGGQAEGAGRGGGPGGGGSPLLDVAAATTGNPAGDTLLPTQDTADPSVPGAAGGGELCV